MQRARSRVARAERPFAAEEGLVCDPGGIAAPPPAPPPPPAAAAVTTGQQLAASSLPPPPPASIYSLYSPRRKAALLLLVCSCCLIVPMTDTIYLPALELVKADLRASQAVAALTVAVYMLGAGTMALVWGPLADRFGRRPCYWACSGAYLAATLGCMLAPTAAALVAARAVQGGAVTGYMAAGAGVIADVFPPRQRGLASAVFSVPMLVGPIVGPLVGAPIAAAHGWRACFLALAAYAAAALALTLAALRRETHHHHALAALGAGAAAALAEGAGGAAAARGPALGPPWRPLGYLLERAVWPYVLVKLTLFASMFSSLVVLPQQLRLRRYEGALRGPLAGLAFVPVALGCFLAAPLGGASADAAAARLAPCRQGRLAPPLALAALLGPAGLLGYGWSLHARAPLGAVLAAHACVGAAVGVFMPALFSYLSVEKQQAASAVASAVQAANLVVAGACIQAAAVAVDRIGPGPLFSALAAAAAAAAAGAGVFTARRLAASRREAAAAAAAAAAGVGQT